MVNIADLRTRRHSCECLRLWTAIAHSPSIATSPSGSAIQRVRQVRAMSPSSCLCGPLSWFLSWSWPARLRQLKASDNRHVFAIVSMAGSWMGLPDNAQSEATVPRLPLVSTVQSSENIDEDNMYKNIKRICRIMGRPTQSLEAKL